MPPIPTAGFPADDAYEFLTQEIVVRRPSVPHHSVPICSAHFSWRYPLYSTERNTFPHRPSLIYAGLIARWLPVRSVSSGGDHG